MNAINTTVAMLFQDESMRSLLLGTRVLRLLFRAGHSNCIYLEICHNQVKFIITMKWS